MSKKFRLEFPVERIPIQIFVPDSSTNKPTDKINVLITGVPVRIHDHAKSKFSNETDSSSSNKSSNSYRAIKSLMRMNKEKRGRKLRNELKIRARIFDESPDNESDMMNWQLNRFLQDT